MTLILDLSGIFENWWIGLKQDATSESLETRRWLEVFCMNHFYSAIHSFHLVIKIWLWLYFPSTHVYVNFSFVRFFILPSCQVLVLVSISCCCKVFLLFNSLMTNLFDVPGTFSILLLIRYDQYSVRAPYVDITY